MTVRRFRRTLWVLVTVLGVGLAGPAMAKGQGGGKPPKDDPPPANFDPVIVYTKLGKGKNHELVVTDADGSNAATALSFSSSNVRASWSPDGTELVIVGTINNLRGIYRLSLFDENSEFAPEDPQLITSDIGPLIGSVAPSPVAGSDGEFWIAFHDENPDSPSVNDIFLVHSSTGMKVPLTKTVDRNELDPTWSPNGDRLAIVSTPSTQSNSPRDVNILELDLTGSVPSIVGETSLIQASEDPLVAPLKQHEWRWPDWAKNGDMLVLMNTSDRQLWLLTTDPALVGDDAAQLTFDVPEVNRGRPGWSPDDTRLIYGRSGLGGACNLGNREPEKVVIADLGVDPDTMATVLEICPGDSGEIGEGRHPDWWRGVSP